MKSVAVIEPNKVTVIDTPVPVPKKYQALVKTEVACICNNTDGELVAGHFPGMENAFPFALGHESVGTVVEIGDKVRNFQVGGRALSGLVFDKELGVEGLRSGWGGFCEYVLVNDHEAMVEDGKYLEEIAEALGRTVNSIRGKLLSTGLRAVQRDKKTSKSDPYEGIEDMLEQTVEEIADHFDKTVRGVKTVLTRRGLACADYTPKSVAE